MTIMIDQSEIIAAEQLPDKIQTLIQLIPEGDNAFEVLLTNKDVCFSFTSPENFIEQLALGIHNSSLIYIPNVQLITDIKKLLDLSTNDLRDLSYRANNNSGQSIRSSAVTAQQKTLLQKYQLLDSSDFSVVNAFYKRNDLSAHPLVWAADFHDQITLQHLLTYCGQAFSCSNAQATSACQWALSQAQNLSELAHYYCLYLAWLQQNPAKNDSINTVIAQLIPLVLSHLKCPTVTFELDARTLNQAIVQWQKSDNAVGFTSLSAGLLNIALNTNLCTPNGLVEKASEYIAMLQKQLAKTLATSEAVGQAGLARYYEFELPNSCAVLSVNGDGWMSIVSDRPNLTKSKAQPNTSQNDSKGVA